MPPRFDETRINEALDSATSLPDPTAMATSAAASAFVTVSSSEETFAVFRPTGASLIPSPTMATTQRLFNFLLEDHLSFDCCFFGAFSWSQRTLSA
jgi:hypothetical protein